MKVKCLTDNWSFFTYGREYEVIFKSGNKYYVNDDEGDETDLRDDECEVIEESNQQVDEPNQQPTQELTREFKVGDKVKIVKKFSERGWLQGWVRPMNETIGKTSEILELGGIDKNSCLLCVDGDKWWYPNESLELVEEAKQDEIKETPVTNDISYQEFLDAFDDEAHPSITARKHEAFIEVNDQSFMCYTKQREQEVMRALIVLYGKLKEKIND